MDIQYIAKICHEVNRAYCQSLGDFSQPPWAEAPDWQKESAVMGVTFHLENPTAGPEGSHNSWLAQKERDGWHYGPIKDPEKKEHPCYVPYTELPQAQQSKDYIFTAIVHALKDL